MNTHKFFEIIKNEKQKCSFNTVVHAILREKRSMFEWINKKQS